jgi:hypothetical protein
MMKAARERGFRHGLRPVRKFLRSDLFQCPPKESFNKLGVLECHNDALLCTQFCHITEAGFAFDHEADWVFMTSKTICILNVA